VVAIFPILGEPPTTVEPGDGTFDDPSLGFDDETFGVIAASDDFNLHAWHGIGEAVLEDRPGIGAVGEQLAEEWELSEQGGHQKYATVAVLNVSGAHQRVQQQPQCVDEDVALLAFNQLACIEAMRIDAGPPFSALFTLWLSTIQTVGLASRSACSRHFTYSASCIFSNVPS
jgi:hypothetical protein